MARRVKKKRGGWRKLDGVAGIGICGRKEEKRQGIEKRKEVD